MKLHQASAALAGLLALFIAGCGSAPATKAETAPAATPAAAAKPALSDDAQKALSQAEADAKAAIASFTFWIPAEKALKSAQEAAKAGDSNTVIKQAKKVSELTKLGMAQTQYPSTEMK